MILENEMAVLGAMFLDDDAIDTALATLSFKDFSLPSHQIIFSNFATMTERAISIDLITFTTELQKAGKLDSVGGSQYIATLHDFSPSSANIGAYISELKDASKKRRIANIGKAIERNLDLPADELLAKVEAAFFAVDDSSTGPEHVKGVVKESFKGIEYSWQHRGETTGLQTGFSDLDALLNGLNSPDLIIVAGRPSMGKSAFMGNIVEAVSIDGKNPSAIFSLEMNKTQLVNRMIFGRSHVDGSRARIGNFVDSDWPKMTNAAGQVAHANIFIDDTPGIHISELRARARRLKRKEKIGLVAVDYLQLLRGDGDNRVQEIGSITRSLKGMAKELDIPVIALCQLSRKVEERTNKRPIMADLRESGDIEQDADIIAFLYRDAVYNQHSDPGDAECIIAKQRNGPTGVIPLTWVGPYSRFENSTKGREYQ